jgi:chemotaxis protein MotB
MKKTLKYAWVLPIIVVTTLYCVPKRKLKAMQQRVYQLQSDSSATHKMLNESNVSNKDLNDQKTALQKANIFAQSEYQDLTKQSKLTIGEQAKLLQKLQNLAQTQKEVMNRLRNSIAEALMNYKTDELSINIKDGMVYVSLEEKLLFKSGSDVIDPKGKEALKSLSHVINATKDIQVMIEGHTDNVPIKTKVYADNWDLSTARANSIVRLLTEYGFDSGRITASGKGKYHPVKDNKTVEGRAANRRTEIILSPNLKELYTLLD